MKKSSVSIGIVAYNEERNISNIIYDILAQNRSTWTLKHIYIACDGCTDNTVSIIQQIHNPFIKLIINPKRQGKATNEQKIFDSIAEDILVMLDADVRLANLKVIEYLIRPLQTQKNVYLTGGNPQPYRPTTFVERAVYTTFEVLDMSRKYLDNGDNIYGASGQCLALKRALIQKIKFTSSIVAEDDYIFFTNKKFGWEFRHVRNAIVFYKLPKSLHEYFYQTQRSDTLPAIQNVEKHFSRHIVRNAYQRPFTFYVRAVTKTLLRHPVETIFIMCFRIFSRVCAIFLAHKNTPQWSTAKSTK